MSWPEALRAVRAWLEPCNAVAILEGVLRDAPTPPQLKALLDWVFAGRGALPLCPLTTINE